MPRRKQAKRTTVKDLRSILRLTYEQGLSVRAISERLQISKTSVATYLLRAREAGLSWPLPPIYESEATLQRALFRRLGRPPQDLREPEWPRVAQELKRKGVTLTLLWQEYRKRRSRPIRKGLAWGLQSVDQRVCKSLAGGMEAATTENYEVRPNDQGRSSSIRDCG
ncbi:transposase [Bradyrhizobium huanghuaihaiense]